MSGLKDKSWVRVVRRLWGVARLEPSRWLEVDKWEEEEEWEIGSGELGVCSLLRVAAPGGEKHLLTMQNRKQLRFKGSNQFSFEG